MLSCNISNYLIKCQSERYIIITNTSLLQHTKKNTEVFKLFSRKVLLINRKDNRNCYKVGYFLRKYQISRVNYWKIKNSWNEKSSEYFYNK